MTDSTALDLAQSILDMTCLLSPHGACTDGFKGSPEEWCEVCVVQDLARLVIAEAEVIAANELTALWDDEDYLPTRYCPCNGECHQRENPCSMDCNAHHGESWLPPRTSDREALQGRIEAVLDYPTSFKVWSFDDWKRQMADAVLDAITEETQP